jgi:3-hydroxyisobutyrate dehydrogenase-like beta-hydroxyacid dehydrogenase
MARRLIDAGHRLAIYDVNPDACAKLAAQGAEMRSSPAAVAADRNNIITSLPGPKEVENVMRGVDGLLSAIRRDALILETSTIGPALSRELAREFAAKGATYLDCPVSNGVQAAQAGTLTFMIGGDAAAVERAKPMLRPLATDIFHLGSIGSATSPSSSTRTSTSATSRRSARACGWDAAPGSMCRPCSTCCASPSPATR